MRHTGLFCPGLFLSLLAAACAPQDDSEGDLEEVGTHQQAVVFTGQGVEQNLPDSNTTGDDENLKTAEHCLMPASLIDDFPVGRQVRLARYSPRDELTHMGLCTVVGQSLTSHVQMTATGMQERVGAGSSQSLVSGVTVSTTTGASVTNAASSIAGTHGGFTQDIREYSLRETGAQVVFMAPHGRIEAKTGPQVDHLFDDRTPGRDAFWAVGLHTDAEDDDDHLHITSGEISELSFPGLATFVNNRMRYAVSFHGFDDAGVGFSEDVLVGGNEAPAFRKGLAEIIGDALSTTGFTARHDLSLTAYAKYRGTQTSNFVNRSALGGRGVQIEQSLSLRGNAAAPDDVAEAVKSVYDCLLDAADGQRVGTGTLASSGSTYTGGSKCPRFVAEYDLTASTGVVSVNAGKPASCAAGRVHVDVYRLRTDATWERVGGGFRDYDASCGVTDDDEYDTPAGIAAPATLRVVVKSVTATGTPDVASVSVTPG